MVTSIKHPAGRRLSLEGGASNQNGTRRGPVSRLSTGVHRLRLVGALCLPIVAALVTRDDPGFVALVAVLVALALAAAMTATSSWWNGSAFGGATGEIAVDAVAATFITLILGDVGGHSSWLIVSLPVIEAASRLPGHRVTFVVAGLIGAVLMVSDLVGFGRDGFVADWSAALADAVVMSVIAIVAAVLLDESRVESRLAVHAGIESDRRARILGAVAAAGCRLGSNDTTSLVEVVVDLGQRLGSSRVSAIEHVGGGRWVSVGAERHAVLAVDRAVANMVRERGTTVQTTNGAVSHAPTGHDPDETVVAIPITDEIVVVVAAPEMPGSLVVEAVEIVAEQAGFAIDRARALELAQAERAELVKRVGQDDMTGLVNRSRFAELLTERAQTEDFTAVLYIDLDRFKSVNDCFGHDIGDRLLVAVAKRLESVIRPGDVAARHGGDEFTVLLGTITSTRDVEAVANRVIGALSQPFVIDDHLCRIGASVGAAASDSPDNIESLIDRADAAMYRAKRAGGDSVAIDRT